MLSTLHHHQEFKHKGEKGAAKLFPRYDGPYKIINMHTETSNYTLDLCNSPHTYPTYYASKLKPFLANNPSLFPNCEYTQPHLVVTNDSLEEYLVQEILNSCQRRNSWQYLVQWTGYRHEHNCWLARSTLNNCEALDV